MNWKDKLAELKVKAAALGGAAKVKASAVKNDLQEKWNNLDKRLLVNLGKGAAAALAVGACVSAVINMPPVALAVLTGGAVYGGALYMSKAPTMKGKIEDVANVVDRYARAAWDTFQSKINNIKTR